jgi:hypothetical protein
MNGFRLITHIDGRAWLMHNGRVVVAADYYPGRWVTQAVEDVIRSSMGQKRFKRTQHDIAGIVASIKRIEVTHPQFSRPVEVAR